MLFYLSPVYRRLFKSLTFNLVFFAGAIGMFPLFVAPFFLPLYTKALGFSSSTGAGLVAGFSLSSAVGRILTGFASDRLGALNTLFLSCMLTAISMLAIWPASTSLGPLTVFVVMNGISNGGFFSTMPTVVSNVFGSARMSVAMSMVITGWIGGYLMVRIGVMPFITRAKLDLTRCDRGARLRDISSRLMEVLRVGCMRISRPCITLAR